MLKKLTALLFAFTVLLSGSAFAAANVKTFTGILSNYMIKHSAGDIKNDIRLARDYSKIIADVYKNFVNGITSLTASLDSYKGMTGIQKYIKNISFSPGIIPANCIEQKVHLSASFADMQNAGSSRSAGTLFLFLILTFILWYIGLLRLFSGDSFFTKQIKV
ncbi:MAG: hypothetical protein FWG57_06205 [Endomicrobia bacterium]|nr:hypothetical protein [Endomicrobiia bacterium]